MDPQVSVIVPVLDDAAGLHRCLSMSDRILQVSTRSSSWTMGQAGTCPGSSPRTRASGWSANRNVARTARATLASMLLGPR